MMITTNQPKPNLSLHSCDIVQETGYHV